MLLEKEKSDYSLNLRGCKQDKNNFQRDKVLVTSKFLDGKYTKYNLSIKPA